MVLSCYQFAPKLHEVEANVEKMLNVTETCEETQILVFPELAVSGYFFQNKEEVIAANKRYISSEIYEKMCEISQKRNMIISYGFPEVSDGKTYNSAQIIFPDSSYNKVYRKTHLFYNEINCFEFGDSGFFNVYYPPFDLNLGTMICYDWRFPEAARTLALKGSDVIICPSNLVTPLWGRVMPGRAIENKVYVAVANRTGTELENGEELLFNGCSAIYNYIGDALAEAGFDSEEMIRAEIEVEKTRNKSFNKFNNIFTDRRTELYK